MTQDSKDTHDPFRKIDFTAHLLHSREEILVTMQREGQHGIAWTFTHPRLPEREARNGEPTGRVLYNRLPNWVTAIEDAMRNIIYRIGLIQRWTAPDQEHGSYQIRFDIDNVLHIRPLVQGWEYSDGSRLITHGDISPTGKLLIVKVHMRIDGDAMSELLKLQKIYDAHHGVRAQCKKGMYVYAPGGYVK